MVELLLKHKAELNVKCARDKETALHRAARLQDERLVRMLLEGGASRKVKDRHGLRKGRSLRPDSHIVQLKSY